VYADTSWLSIPIGQVDENGLWILETDNPDQYHCSLAFAENCMSKGRIRQSISMPHRPWSSCRSPLLASIQREDPDGTISMARLPDSNHENQEDQEQFLTVVQISEISFNAVDDRSPSALISPIYKFSVNIADR
jgi:hypothetical protein